MSGTNNPPQSQSTIDGEVDEILKKYNNHILYEMGSKIAKEYPRLNSKQTEAALKQWAAQAANKAGKVAAKLNRIELDEILQNYCPTTNNADVIRIRNAKAAITNLIAQEANKARIDESLLHRDFILYDEAAIDKLDERIWHLKQLTADKVDQ